MIARLPEMHQQLRELATLAAHLSPHGADPAEPSTEDDPTGF